MLTLLVAVLSRSTSANVWTVNSAQVGINHPSEADPNTSVFDTGYFSQDDQNSLSANGFENYVGLGIDGHISVSGFDYQDLGATSVEFRWTGTLPHSVSGGSVSTNLFAQIFNGNEVGTLGTVNWTLHETAGAGSITLTGSEDGSYYIEMTGQGSYNIPATTDDPIPWTTTFTLQWSTDFSQDPILDINIPFSETIDQTVGVPEPASLGLFGFTAVPLLLKRRRRAICA